MKRPPRPGVEISKGEPHNRLTELCDIMSKALDAALTEEEQGKVKCAIMIDNGEMGGIVLHGYGEDYAGAAADLFMHMRAIMRANGQELSFAAFGQDPKMN